MNNLTPIQEAINHFNNTERVNLSGMQVAYILKQFIKPKTEGILPPITSLAGVWVRANKRQSGHYDKKCCRRVHSEYYFTGYYDNSRKCYVDRTGSCFMLDEIEWLDDQDIPSPVENKNESHPPIPKDQKETFAQYLERRIKELNKADSEFCADRWNMSKPEFERHIAREMSNQVTFARQELQTALKQITGPIEASQESIRLYSLEDLKKAYVAFRMKPFPHNTDMYGNENVDQFINSLNK